MLEGINDAAFVIQILVAFGAGIISFISPCVLPLVPGYLSMMSGYSAAQIEAGDYSTSRMLRVIFLFIAGFTVVFTAYAAAATAIGQFLVRNMGPLTTLAGWVVVAFGLLMIAMAVSDKGVLGVLNRERRMDVRPSRLGKFAPPVMGAAFAFAWTPCIGPVLAMILTTAGVQDTVGRGMLLLVAYSLGLGVPFLMAGLGLFKVWGRLKPYMKPIAIGSGLLLTAFGLIMVTGHISTLASWFTRIITSIPWLEDLATI